MLILIMSLSCLASVDASGSDSFDATVVDGDSIQVLSVEESDDSGSDVSIDNVFIGNDE